MDNNVNPNDLVIVPVGFSTRLEYRHGIEAYRAELARSRVGHLCLRFRINGVWIRLLVERDTLYIVGFKSDVAAKYNILSGHSAPPPILTHSIKHGSTYQDNGLSEMHYLDLPSLLKFHDFAKDIPAESNKAGGMRFDYLKKALLIAFILFSEAARFPEVQVKMERLVGKREEVDIPDLHRTVLTEWKSWSRPGNPNTDRVAIKHLPGI